MPVVRSASLHTIEDASHVFEQVGSLDYYTLKKARTIHGMCVGNKYNRATVEMFASWNPGTLIIEGGNDMTTNNQRTITLVTIPQEVADAIKSCRKSFASNATIIEYTNTRYTSERLVALRTIPMDTLLSALVNGYVVEKSAEELAHDAIRTRYLYLKHNADNGNNYAKDANSETVRTLDTLDIKIEGVNA